MSEPTVCIPVRLALQIAHVVDERTHRLEVLPGDFARRERRRIGGLFIELSRAISTQVSEDDIRVAQVAAQLEMSLVP